MSWSIGLSFVQIPDFDVPTTFVAHKDGLLKPTLLEDLLRVKFKRKPNGQIPKGTIFREDRLTRFLSDFASNRKHGIIVKAIATRLKSFSCNVRQCRNSHKEEVLIEAFKAVVAEKKNLFYLKRRFVWFDMRHKIRSE